MDPVTAGVVTNLIATAIISVANWSVRSSRDLLFHASAPTSPEAPIREAVNEALVELGAPEKIDDRLGGDRYREFLSSPDLFTLVERLTVARITGDEAAAAGLHRELTASWALWVGRTRDEIAPHGERLLGRLTTAVDAGIAEGANAGLLDLAEARAAFRSRVMSEQLASIDRRLAFIASVPSIDEFHRFEVQYRDAVKDRSSLLTPPHIDDARRVPLEDIYVDPDFEVKVGRSWQDQRFPLATVRRGLFRTVLLGQPGGGKSTFTQKLCADLTAQYSDGLVGGVALTPILIVLREYAAAAADHPPLPFVGFVEEHANVSYSLTPPDGAVEYMLQQGRALVIFDGLDEIVEPARRRQMRDSIESFASRFPAARLLVTSREIGYEQASLDDEAFESVRLAEFSNDQVADYSGKWFHAHPDPLPKAQREQQTQAFLRESALVASDLRRNPLLLALMCNLYKGEGYIPTNRPEIYEKCSNMLLRRWDASRGIEVPRPLGAHLERTLQHLAHWMFMQPGRQAGVQERELVGVAADYLSGKRFEDHEEALAEAASFLEFCKGRAWVLVKVGAKGGQPLFQFAHRTFLEYFAAEHLVRNSGSPEELGEKLLPKLGQSSWDVVAQLAVQIQNGYREGAGDQLLEQFLGYAAKGNHVAHRRALMFDIRALQFLVPTPVVTRNVVTAGLNVAMNIGVTNKGGLDAPPGKAREVPQPYVDALAAISEENLPVAVRATRETFFEAVAGNDRSTRAVALNIALDLPGAARAPSALAAWSELVTELWQEQEDRILATAQEDPILAVELLQHERITAEDLAEWHGAQWLFAPTRSHVGVRRVSWSLVIAYFSSEPAPPDYVAPRLAEAARILPKQDMPWVPGRWALDRSVSPAVFSRRFQEEAPKDLPSEETFGAFCVLAPWAQVERFGERVGAWGRLVVPLLEARRGGADAEQLHALCERLGWDDAQREFAVNWARGRTSAVGRAPRPSGRS